MSISAKQVKELREATGAGFGDCKKALVESDGDMAKAVEYLQRKQLASAAKKSGRIAAEGAVASYIHPGSRIGVLLEVNCETDFVARNEDFQQFCKDICMQVAASRPTVVHESEISQAELDQQTQIFKAQAMEEGKPEHIAEKIVVGRLKKWFKEVVLLQQPFVKDDKKTVGELQSELSGKIGEKISVRRFTRYEVGEGLEKRTYDLAAEVAEQIDG